MTDDTYKETCTHTTQLHREARTYKYTQRGVLSHTYVHAQTYECTHTIRHCHVQQPCVLDLTHRHTHTHTHTHTHKHTHKHTEMHTNIYTHKHTEMHTNLYTHMHSRPPKVLAMMTHIKWLVAHSSSWLTALAAHCTQGMV